MFDILLAAINAKWIHPALSLRLLKANLGTLESSAEILEFNLRQPLQEKTQSILTAEAKILGLSVSIWNHSATQELLEALAAVWKTGTVPRPIIVLGGPEVSYLERSAEIFHYADYVIRGEGELVFRELCETILFPNNGPQIEFTLLSPFLRDASPVFIDAIAFSLNIIKSGYSLYTDEDLNRKLVYVEASRGCPFNCDFCLSSVKPVCASSGRRDNKIITGSSAAVREFPLEKFLEEMNDLYRRGTRTFKFLDRTFNLDIDRARRIMEFFLERIESESSLLENDGGTMAASAHSRPLVVHFEMVPSRFPAELREILTRFPPGSLRLEIGIQTLNSETAALINRPGDGEAALEVIRFLGEKTNAIIHADLIAGLPGEDLASFGSGFDRLWLALSAPDRTDAPQTEIQLGILKCLPGTPIVRHSSAHGMQYKSEPPYEVISTDVLPAIDLDRIKNFARFWELIVNRGHFPDFSADLVPCGKPVFWRFMDLSDRLLVRFGRNWGIDRKELREALNN